MKENKKKKIAGLLACLSLFQGAKTGAKTGANFVLDKKLGTANGLVFNPKDKKDKFISNKLLSKYCVPATVVTLAGVGAVGAYKFFGQKSVYKIKFKFAGSGDLVWRKAFPNKQVSNQYVTSRRNLGSAFFEFGKKVINHSKNDLRDTAKIKGLLNGDSKLYVLACESSNKYLLYTIGTKLIESAPSKSMANFDEGYCVEIKNLESDEKLESYSFNDLEELKKFINSKYDYILEYFNSGEHSSFLEELGNKKIEKIDFLDLAKMIQKCGKLLCLKNTDKNNRECYVWKKEIVKTKKVKYDDWSKSKIHQVEYTIPGPQVFGGALDAGEFSIIRNISNGFFVLKEEIDKYLDKDDKIYVSVKGHSRGGVAANIVLNKIAKKFGNKIEINSVAFDPVPGNALVSNAGGVAKLIEWCKGLPYNSLSWLTSWFQTNKKSDQELEKELSDILAEQKKSEDIKNYSEINLENTKNSAVIYALKSDYETLGLVSGVAYVDFQPQRILNSKVTIISEIGSKNAYGGNGHGVGMQQIETDAKSGKVHKHYFYFDNKAYSQGNLWQLPAGLYWVGDDFKLEKIDGNKALAADKLKFVENMGDKVDAKRREFLRALIKSHMK